MERMGSVPGFPESERGLELCSQLLIKHDLVSNSSVMLRLIFDDALHFSFCAPFHLFKRCDVIGRTAIITMADGFPGGCSAVAKILSGGEDSPRFQQPQMWSDATVFLQCKERVFPLVWQADPRGTLACVYNICLTFWSWLCTQGRIHTYWHTYMRQMRWGDKILRSPTAHTLFSHRHACKYAQK